MSCTRGFTMVNLVYTDTVVPVTIQRKAISLAGNNENNSKKLCILF
jgi:hypothetical protein